jgi:hypothetical protein
MLFAKLLFLGAGAAVGAVLFLVALAIAVLVFEVVMFIDVIRNPAISDERKLLWAIGMFLFHPFVAIAYYFTDHKAA